MSNATQLTDHTTEATLFALLLQLVVIILAARLGGSLAVRVGQTAVVGEIVAGLLLGPSLFGQLAPGLFATAFDVAATQPLELLSQIGLILLMFQVGMAFDFLHLRERRNRQVMLAVAVASLMTPFVLGFGFGHLSAPILSPQTQPLAAALFIATAFSITALPILGRIMMDLGMTRSVIGVVAISAAAINDVVGWLLLALITALVMANFDATAFGFKILLLVLFLTVSWYLLRPLMKTVLRRLDVGHAALSVNQLGFVLAMVFGAAMVTQGLGIFAIFGGFMMGVLLHDEGRFAAAWQERISPLVAVFFLPVFFTYTGLRTDIGTLAGWQDWGWCALLVTLATLGKFGGAYIAARMAGLNHNESRILGVMMNTRALMELIVINVGYDLGVISAPLFTMLVIMAVFSTVVTSPLLRRWLPGLRLAGFEGSAAAQHASAQQQR